jgi:hypothetical protein
MTDPAAVFTEPILTAWGLRHHLLSEDADLALLDEAFQEAERSQKPVALLLPEEAGFGGQDP